MANPIIDLQSNQQPSIYYVIQGTAIFHCEGSPNGVIAANKGSLALDVTNGRAYLKTTDTLATGWQLIDTAGAANPAPPPLSVQYNNAGAFGGSVKFEFDPSMAGGTVTTDEVSISNTTAGHILSLGIWNQLSEGSGAELYLYTNPDGLMHLRLRCTDSSDANVNFLGIPNSGIVFTSNVATGGLILCSDEPSADIVFVRGGHLFANEAGRFSANKFTVQGNTETTAGFQSGVFNSVNGSLLLHSQNTNDQTIQSADTPVSSLAFKWPSADPTLNQVLTASAPAAGIVTLTWTTPGGGGGMAIGGAISGGTANRVLFEGAGPVLADDANLTWNSISGTLKVTQGLAFFNTDYGIQQAVSALNIGAQTGGHVRLGLFNAGVFTNVLSVNTSPNPFVGIGTDSPSFPLDIAPSANGTVVNIIHGVTMGLGVQPSTFEINTQGGNKINIGIGTSGALLVGVQVASALGAPQVGFLGTTAQFQQTGGAATAGGTYTATEQTMLQKAYDCLRTFGLLS